jgi:hypothetical protein
MFGEVQTLTYLTLRTQGDLEGIREEVTNVWNSTKQLTIPQKMPLKITAICFIFLYITPLLG